LALEKLERRVSLAGDIRAFIPNISDQHIILSSLWWERRPKARTFVYQLSLCMQKIKRLKKANQEPFCQIPWQPSVGGNAPWNPDRFIPGGV
jgi:hypothetical protein